MNNKKYIFLNKHNISTLDERINYRRGQFIDGYYYLKDDWNIKKNYGPDVVYKLNSEGFRTKNFKKFNKENINIIYSGCSWSFGEGIPDEFIWTSLLDKKILNHKNKNIDSVNLSYPGSSIDLIIKNIMSYIRNYGNPNYIFICFPGIDRKIHFSKYRKKYIKATTSPTILLKPFVINDIERDIKDYTVNYIEENNILYYSILINIFIDYCSTNNIKLYFTTWEFNQNNIFKNLEFDSYIESLDLSHLVTNEELTDLYPYKNTEDLPYWNIAQDNSHPGTFWHQAISNLFFERIKND